MIGKTQMRDYSATSVGTGGFDNVIKIIALV